MTPVYIYQIPKQNGKLRLVTIFYKRMRNSTRWVVTVNEPDGSAPQIFEHKTKEQAQGCASRFARGILPRLVNNNTDKKVYL